jgi:hypothetical protein
LCNLYSVTKGQQAICEFTGAMRDRTGNLPPLPSIFPDYYKSQATAPPPPDMAGGAGFEPGLTESESGVLPLNYPPPAPPEKK